MTWFIAFVFFNPFIVQRIINTVLPLCESRSFHWSNIYGFVTRQWTSKTLTLTPSVFFSVAVGLKWNLSIKWERLKVPSFSAIRKGPTCLRRQRLVWESKAFSDPYLGRAGRLELFSLNIVSFIHFTLWLLISLFLFCVFHQPLSPKTLTCPKIVDWLSLTCHWDVLINHLIRYSASFEAASLFRKIGFPVKFSLLTRRPGNNVK